MKDFTFIHAADLHLDSPFIGVSYENEKIAEALRRATFEAFDRLINLAIESEALFVVIAGDVYDQSERSIKAQLRFLDGLRRLDREGICSFVAHGNHDSLSGWINSIDWPESTVIFGAEVETHIVQKDGEPVAAVSGVSYKSRDEERRLFEYFEPTNPELFQVAVLHCNCGAAAGYEEYVSCSGADLIGRDFDYWALGHVHERRVICDRPTIAYPGNIQGRSIREQGERGCYRVRASVDKSADLKFAELDSIRWFGAELNVSDIDSIDGLRDAILAELERLSGEADRPIICRISIGGESELYDQLAQPGATAALVEEIRSIGIEATPFFWLQKLENRLAPKIDLAGRREGDDLVGMLLRLSDEIKAGAEEPDELAEILDELYANARAKRIIERPGKNRIDELLAEAEKICVRMLEG